MIVGAGVGIGHIFGNYLAGALRNPDGQGFAALGQVVFGMDTVRRIHAGETDPAQGEAYVQGQMLKQPVRLLWAREVK